MISGFRIIVMCLWCTPLFAQTTYFLSNEEFFQKSEILEENLSAYVGEYILELTREGLREDGQLKLNNIIRGSIARTYDESDRLLLEERKKQDGSLIDRVQYSYYPDGRPRVMRREDAGGNEEIFVISELRNGGFEYFQFTELYDRIRVHADKAASVLFQELRNANDSVEQQRRNEDVDGLLRIEKIYSAGDRLVEFFQDNKLIFQEEYNAGVLRRRVRRVYSPTGQLQLLLVEQADKETYTEYFYDGDVLVREELYEENDILRSIDYSEDEGRVETYFRNGKVFVVETYSGESKIDVQIFQDINR